LPERRINGAPTSAPTSAVASPEMMHAKSNAAWGFHPVLSKVASHSGRPGRSIGCLTVGGMEKRAET
jgi:hypothetical protein